MHIPNVPPMTGGQEVICIEATRVCDFCFQEHRVDRTFPITAPGTTRPRVDCTINERNIVCREVERRPVDGNRNNVLVCLAIEVPVTINVGNETLNQRIVFLKQAVICAPEGTDVTCRVTGDCCCFFDPQTNTVSCVFNFCVVIQSQADVHVLVPTLGIAAPKECRSIAGGCPPAATAGITDACDQCGTPRPARSEH